MTGAEAPDAPEHISRETKSFTEKIAMQIKQRRAGLRRNVRHGGTLCSGCLECPPQENDAYCPRCRASAAKQHRDKIKQELVALRAQVEGKKKWQKPNARRRIKKSRKH
jgi:uncharacterized paraquat-inducible protein A